MCRTEVCLADRSWVSHGRDLLISGWAGRDTQTQSPQLSPQKAHLLYRLQLTVSLKFKIPFTRFTRAKFQTITHTISFYTIPLCVSFLLLVFSNIIETVHRGGSKAVAFGSMKQLTVVFMSMGACIRIQETI